MKRIVLVIITLLLPLLMFAQTAAECYQKGENYYYGRNGVGIDYAESLKWARKAADQGHSGGQFRVGVIYEFGKGVAKNDVEAVKWYRKAAEQGNVSAQYNLGLNYEYGRGVIRNDAEAVKWYRKAAEQGDSDAQYRLGFFIECGRGVPQDFIEAAKWFQKSAEQGNNMAQNSLGLLYNTGNGGHIDYELAMKWFKKSAAQGNQYAMRNIGFLYEYGYGVTQNYQTAKEWYQKALAKDPNYDSVRQSLALVNTKIAEQQATSNSNAQNTPAKQQTTTTILMDDVDKDIPQGSKNENLFAVIIGNEKYKNEQDVPFAENDASMFREYCIKTLGVEDKHIQYFANAGYNDINMAIHWLKTRMEAYDGEASAIFYYAGHGIPDESSKEGYLLPVDGMGSMLATAYSLRTLNDELAKMPARSVAVFLDACFSGANRDGRQMASTRGVALKVNATAPKGKVIMFSAAQGDQTASPYKEQNHGLFTYFLLRKLKETKGKVTYGELSDYLIRQVKRASVDVNNRLQSPSVQVSDQLRNKWESMNLK